MALTALPGPVFGKLSIAGAWKGESDQHWSASWPEEYWSRDEDGSLLIFGKKLRGMPLFSGKTGVTRIRIDPYLSQWQSRIDSASWIDLPLDGSQKNFVPLFELDGIGSIHCTSRSYSEIAGEGHWGDGTTFRWKFQLQEGGERCKFEQILKFADVAQAEHVETEAILTHYFTRIPVADFRKNQLFKMGNPCVLAPSNLEKNQQKRSLDTLAEDHVLEIHPSGSRCGCLPFRVPWKSTGTPK